MEDWNTAGSVEELKKHYFQHLHKLSRSLHHPLKNESANEVKKFARLNKTLISSSRNGRFNYRNFNF
jgi:hypothetical protein